MSLNLAVSIPYSAIGALERTYSEPYRYRTGLEACQGGPLPDVVQSVPKRTVPCLDRRLNIDPYHTPVGMQRAPHRSGGKSAKWVPRGYTLVHFLQECLNAHEANHPGMVRSGAARYGTVRFQKHLYAALVGEQGQMPWQYSGAFPLQTL